MTQCHVALLTDAVYDDIHGFTLLPRVALLSFVHHNEFAGSLFLAQIEVSAVIVNREPEFGVPVRAGIRLV